MKYRWSNPHPGMMGCLKHLPEPIHDVIDALNGTETTKEHAVARIMAAAVKCGPSLYDIKLIDLSWLLLTEETPKGVSHCWRLLKAKAV